jgi:hypothetical protein
MLHTSANEGMWLPYLFPDKQLEEMKNMGLSIPFDSIYNIQSTSIKDAIVSLDDGGCTGSFISSKGLLLTNHHCAFDNIQSHSTVENDLLTNGFWAQTYQEELINPSKTATVLVDAQDVTSRIKSALHDSLPESQRTARIDSISSWLRDSVSLKTGHEVSVASFFNGNRFFLFITQTYRDVRLVGAPPSSIGKFGGDTDNWVWPRHTGDFAFYRVYTGPDGQPADYSPNNIPFQPKKHLSIDASGILENDFTLIMGYPGQTNRYLSSHGVQQLKEITNPLIAEIRGIKQNIWQNAMDTNRHIQIQYAAKHSSSSNYWKYCIGQNEGLEQLNVIDEKKELEQTVTDWLKQDSLLKATHEKSLSLIQIAYLLSKELKRSETIAVEALLTGPELLLFALTTSSELHALSDHDPHSKSYQTKLDSLTANARQFYSNFNASVDKEVFTQLLEYYLEHTPEDHKANAQALFPKNFDGRYSAFSDNLYNNSVFRDSISFFKAIESPEKQFLFADPLLEFSQPVLEKYFQISALSQQFEAQIERNLRKFTQAQMLMQPEKDFYPDANSTLRLSYGKVASYEPTDGVLFDYKTTLQGMLEKAKNNSHMDFSLDGFDSPDGALTAIDANMPLCFITNNDITGGNSGSPVLNHKGELIGLAFDGNWEAMTSDLAYSPELQRTICVDIRYILFILNYFPSASHLIEEVSVSKN